MLFESRGDSDAASLSFKFKNEANLYKRIIIYVQIIISSSADRLHGSQNPRTSVWFCR
jgi:hypothetical protein